MILKNYYMINKYIFIGDENSVNIEIIAKSFDYLKNKVKYILIADFDTVLSQLKLLKSNLKIKQVNDPLNFKNLDKNCLNVFNIMKKKRKIDTLILQINISNYLSNITKNDLVTMPIDKSIFIKKMKFNGLTEYLGKINNCKTIMLMTGEKFSIIPVTTHINLNNVGKKIEYKINNFFKILKSINDSNHVLNDYKSFKFLCFNPHCGENGLKGNQDFIIEKYLKKNKFLKFKLIAADSAFKQINLKTLYISMYHDQALIPFKIINNNQINQTLGLNYRRLSPAHGVAKDIKFRNKADTRSYISCMLF